MKHIFTLVILTVLAIVTIAQTQTTRTITWDGLERQYIEYVPASYNSEILAPVVFCLHGLGDNMANFSNIGFHQLANLTGWIVITPQALDAEVMGSSFGTAWNAGVGATGTMLGDIFLNPNVDDTGFLTEILDSLENNLSINADSVFFAGFSLGGFMCNRMASELGSRITAIASVSGTMGVGFTPNPLVAINTMHIHGTADTQIGYANADFDTPLGVYSVGMGAEALVEYWRNYNLCDAEPIISNFPNTRDDGKTFERYLYENGTNGVKTAFIKVLEGDHEWCYIPQNDIDCTTEIFKFFTNTMDFPSSIETIAAELDFFPNPASNFITINAENPQVSIVDVTGKIVMYVNERNNNSIDISNLSVGMYIVRINSNGNISDQKLQIVR